MFSCPTCRKCCWGFGLSTWSILPPWSCCSPQKEGSGLLGGQLCPARGPAGSAWSPLAHHALFAQPSTALFFPRSRFQGLGGWFFFSSLSSLSSPHFFFFFKVPAIPWKDNPKSREVGNQSNTLLVGEAGLPSFWDNPPAWLHTAKSKQGFPMISLLFLTRHSSCRVPNTLDFCCWSLTQGRMQQTLRRVAKCWKCSYNPNKPHYFQSPFSSYLSKAKIFCQPLKNT